MFGIIDVDEVPSERFLAGVSLLSDAGGFRFDGVEMIRADGVIHCAAMVGESAATRIPDCSDRNRLSDADAARLLQHARNTCSKLCALSGEFRQATCDQTIRYSVICRYGHGSVTLHRDSSPEE